MKKEVYVDISARHVHLCEETFKQLFGADAEMKEVKKITGAFVCEQRVTLVGEKGKFERVAILGPYRPNQIELAMTDARKIGVPAPIRISGDTKGSAPIKIIGTAGEVELEEGAIVAKRHIHLPEDVAADWGVKKNDAVKVKVESEDRSLVFGDVLIRTTPPGTKIVMHIDTDECNAAGLPGPVNGEVVD